MQLSTTLPNSQFQQGDQVWYGTFAVRGEVVDLDVKSVFSLPRLMYWIRTKEYGVVAAYEGSLRKGTEQCNGE